MDARDIERDVALMVWSLLSGGYLSGEHIAQNGESEQGRRTNLNFPPINPRKVDLVVEELRVVANGLNAAPSQGKRVIDAISTCQSAPALTAYHLLSSRCQHD